MLIYAIYIVFILFVFNLLYIKLTSFKNPRRVIIAITLVVLTTLGQVALTMYGIQNGMKADKLGILILSIPIGIWFSEIIIISLMASIINKYNTDNINMFKFIVYMIIIISVVFLLNIWIYI